MEVVDVARWQFALTAGLHFVLVATTLGLAPLLAWLQTRHARTAGDRRARIAVVRDQMLRLYLANYGAGLVTGLVMELQMGLNWSGVPGELYDPIGSTLAVETLVAFLLESTLLGMFLVSAGRFSESVRAGLLWGVTVTAWVSAAVVVSANAWMQNPDAVEFLAGSSFATPSSMLMNPFTWSALLHILPAALAVGSAWVIAIGIAAARRGAAEVGKRTARAGSVLLLVMGPLIMASGMVQFFQVKPLVPDDTPVLATLSIGTMMLVGTLAVILGLAGVFFSFRWNGRCARPRPLLQWAALGTPFVLLAAHFAGWVYRETIRQPWFIHGRVTVADALSVDSLAVVVTTTLVFVALSGLAVGAAWTFMVRDLRRVAVVEPVEAEVMA